MTLPLSANLGFLWPDRPLLARIDAAGRAGFDAIELHWPYDVPAAEVKAAAAAHGMPILGVNAPRGDAARGENGFAALPGREAEFQASLDRALDYAAAIGAANIHVLAGVQGAAPFQPARETFITNLSRGAKQAAERGVTLLIEPLNHRDAPGYHLSRVEDAATVIAAVGAPNLKIMFDLYHVAIEGGDLTRRLERFMPMIGHVQFAGVPDRSEPDDSETDLAHLFRTLERLGWSKPVGAEYRPRGDTDAGLGWRALLAA